MSPHVGVVGGGITGLTAAYHLRRTTPELDVTVFEGGPEPGGKLRTGSVGDLRLETGADAFLVRDPDALELCEQLGLEDDLVQPAVQGVRIWADGRAHPLPAGLVFGAPTRFAPLFRSGLISGRGALRATLDLVMPRAVDVDDASVAGLVRHRFGREVLERLVEPLLSGIYAGDPEQLGAAAATPRLADAAREHRSLASGLRATTSDGRRAEGSIFRSLRGGMSRLIDRLAGEVRVETRSPVRLVARSGEGSGSGYVLQRSTGEPVEVDALILAVPAFAAGALLRDIAPDASQTLRRIPYVSVASIITVHEPGSVEVTGSGMLVPHGASRAVKAVTYVSNKWEHLVDDDRVVLRSSVGRRGSEEAVGWEDERLVDTVLRDLRDLVGVHRSPTEVEVTRWERALPQYETDHLDRLARLDRALATHQRLALAGAAYRGVGISACVQDGRRAAARIASALDSVPS